jgi:hypothetical protein
MRNKPMKVSLLALGMTVLLATAASASGPWSLFGDARPVREGLQPNPWAVELCSTCPPDSKDCLAENALTVAGVTFKAPNRKLTFADIYRLSASYKIREGDCGGGSPRFSIGIDTDADGAADGDVFVYIGPAPEFTGCPADTWSSTGNLMKEADARFEISQFIQENSSVYLTYEEASGLLADTAHQPVVYILLVADGGWDEGQVVLVDSVQVNNFRINARGFTKKK